MDGRDFFEHRQLVCEAVMNRGTPESRSLSTDSIVDIDVAPSCEQRLTPQEIRLLGLLAKGHSYDICAGELSVSINTVRNYIRSVYAKLAVHSKVEAVTKALRKRIIV